MSTIKCMIIDDEPIACDIIESYLKKLKGFELLARYSNAIDALEYLSENKVDLIFLDIEMPELTGLQFLEIRPNSSKVILTTAHREFAFEGFEYNVLDYLLKPISFERFYIAVNKFKETAEKLKDYIFLKVDNKQMKIHLESIVYIEGFGNYAKVSCVEAQYLVYRSLNDLEKVLASSGFIRCHKSYIISLNKVKSYTKNALVLSEREIAIGQSFKKQIFERLRNL